MMFKLLPLAVAYPEMSTSEKNTFRLMIFTSEMFRAEFFFVGRILRRRVQIVLLNGCDETCT